MRLCNTQFSVLYGDIVKLDADAVTIPASPSMRMEAGISAKIKEKAGQEVEEEAVQQAPGSPGEALLTGGGNMPAGHIFHCVMLDKNNNGSPDYLRLSVRDSLLMANSMGLKRIAFPAIGASFTGLNPRVSTTIIVEETRKAVEEGMPFTEIIFIVCDPAPYIAFKRALKLSFNKESN